MDTSIASPVLEEAPAPKLQLNAKRKCALVVGVNGSESREPNSPIGYLESDDGALVYPNNAKYRVLQMDADNCDRIDYVESDVLGATKRAGVVKYPEVVDAINKELPREVKVFNCNFNSNAQKSCSTRY
ncbi:hypothetical protein Pmar_PMAR014118 [Perkinsus marinus ATCC 50983]|uniref:Uncharacterized protein n=1 Tax=Perkinsus marinus (strain ATCC 50983 / TXsc) TaxID=423536 RepID=C5KQE8_PERM5|nr:hypothetical protein Pmar_PMAR014118 [Perkinsus marinus ATCC 50983]EER13295.1 hypothetical protein Pmar_PMAR014118 [Perkinsus marinus ATCC 50983]|eukprot:XP_002781500.1 hypothetical protein Pmar_PMAR014118 [Perkinsus marinus ATCC 50983]